MAKLKEYRETVQRILIKYSQHKPSYDEVEVERIFDPERDRYQIVINQKMKYILSDKTILKVHKP